MGSRRRSVGEETVGETEKREWKWGWNDKIGPNRGGGEAFKSV